MSRIVEVWDRPTRIFHWSLGLSVAAAWITADPRSIDQHVFFGCVVAGLLAFRLVWGMIGSQTARFADFVKGPGVVLAWMRGAAPSGWGHNPLAGAAVVALLAAAGWATVSGLALGDAPAPATAARHATAANLLGALIALHIVSIFVYAARGRNLIGPMLSGVRAAPDDAGPPPAIRRDRAALAAGGACAALALALYAL